MHKDAVNCNDIRIFEQKNEIIDNFSCIFTAFVSVPRIDFPIAILYNKIIA